MNRGFGVIFFVLITSTVLVMAMLNNIWWHALIRDHATHRINHYINAAVERSSSSKAYFQLQNS